MATATLYLFLCVISFATSNPIHPDPNNKYLVPKRIIPIYYDISIEPDLSDNKAKLNYQGNVTIHFQPAEPGISDIYLYIGYLRIKAVNLTGNGSQIDLTYNTEITCNVQNFLVIKVAKPLSYGDYDVHVQYESGNIFKKTPEGFFKAFFKDEAGNEQALATTHFQKGFARNAFPCIDEPEYKAHFNICIIRPRGYVSLSNESPKSSVQIAEKKYRDCFKSTDRMSTYLVAFSVVPYEFQRNENLRVYARPAAVRNGWTDYALNVGPKLLKSYSDYLGANFTPTHLNQIAIPDGGKFIGTENWGLISFGENNIFYSNKSSASDMERVARTIAHEYAHNWFGNLVTPIWWSYFWLSESFAGFFEYEMTSKIYPEWQLEQLFVFNKVHTSFLDDANQDVCSLNSIEDYCPLQTSFYLNYQKGPSIIRMIRYTMPESTFKDVLVTYINQNQYKSVTPEQLSEALKTHLPDINFGLDKWVNQSGFPLVTATMKSKTLNIQLKQQRFFWNQSHQSKELWNIPITYAFAGDANFDTNRTIQWLKKEKDYLNVDPPTDDWFLINVQQIGYYRVNYNKNNWKNLIKYLHSDNFNNIHVLNRAQLIDDSFNLARAGVIKYDIPLKLAEYLKKETEYLPLAAFLKAIEYIDIIGASHEEYHKLKDYVVDILTPHIEKYTYIDRANDTHMDKYMRNILIYWLCKYEVESCLYSTSYSLVLNNLPPDLKDSIICGSLRSKGKPVVETIHKKMDIIMKIFSLEEQVNRKQLSSLSCIQDPAYLKQQVQMLASITYPDKFKEHLSMLNDNPSSFNVILDELSDGLASKIKKNEIDNFNSIYYSILSTVVKQVTTKKQHTKVKNILEQNITDLTKEQVQHFQLLIKNKEKQVKILEQMVEDFYKILVMGGHL